MRACAALWPHTIFPCVVFGLTLAFFRKLSKDQINRTRVYLKGEGTGDVANRVETCMEVKMSVK